MTTIQVWECEHCGALHKREQEYNACVHQHKEEAHYWSNKQKEWEAAKCRPKNEASNVKEFFELVIQLQHLSPEFTNESEILYFEVISEKLHNNGEIVAEVKLAFRGDKDLFQHRSSPRSIPMFDGFSLYGSVWFSFHTVCYSVKLQLSRTAALLEKEKAQKEQLREFRGQLINRVARCVANDAEVNNLQNSITQLQALLNQKLDEKYYAPVRKEWEYELSKHQWKMVVHPSEIQFNFP